MNEITTTPKANLLLSSAKQFIQDGFSVIPLSADKRPLVAWKEFQDRQANIQEVEKWFKTLSVK